MKTKDISYLVFNLILFISGMLFSFSKIFIETEEVRYSVTSGVNLFWLENTFWTVLTKITLIALLAVLLAAVILQVFLSKGRSPRIFLALVICTLLSIVLLVTFAIFSQITCNTLSSFGFGQSMSYRFNAGMIICLVIWSVMLINMFLYCLDIGHKHKKTA